MESTATHNRLAPGRKTLLIFWLVTLVAVPAARAARPQSQTPQMEVTDELGRHVKITQPVMRIVSLAPNLTETLFALGAGDRVVGDTDYCDFPAEAKAKAHVGGPVDPNIETVAALHPDLVLAGSINRLATVRSLERLGITVYATDPRSVDDVLTSIERLGQVIGANEQSHALAADLRRRLDDLRQRVSGLPPKTVFFVAWQSPVITTGRNTFLADALRRAGGRPVIDAQQDWPAVSMEEVVKLQPDYLIFSSDEVAQARREIEQLRDRPGWRDLEAVRNGRVILLGEAISEPSPRLIAAIEELARALYPGQFSSGDNAVPHISVLRAANAGAA